MESEAHSQVMEQLEPITVFISYADEDRLVCEKLETHLSGLKRQGLILPWQKRLVPPGAEKVQEIERQLNTASIILLLISANFIDSDYCYGIEMKQALERHNTKNARVIPIIVRHCNWSDSPFAKLECLPSDGKPIYNWKDQDFVLKEITAQIRKVVEELQELRRKQRNVTPPHREELAQQVDNTTRSVPLNHPVLPENHAIFPDFLIWHVPYPRNPLFIGREHLLTDLEAAFQSGQTAAVSQPQAIIGLGGIGKTQLALEYAYRHREDYQVILWALADTRENLTSSYLTIAGLLNLAGQDGDRVIIAVKQWLQRRHGWLLILDNADDLSLAREFLPLSFGGHVLLTTRTQAPGRFARRLEVNVLSTEVGVLFLLRRAGALAPEASLNQVEQAEQEVAQAIYEELGGLPLALDQAGAYIEETGCGLLGYQQLYQQHRAALLAERRGELVDDHPLPVAMTWRLSFQQVEQKNPAAADLLRVCAFLAPDAIPEEMITGGAHALGPVLGPISSDQLRMNEIVEKLLRFSLIRRNSQTRTLTIHRLVQAVIQDDMDEEMRRTWAERAVRLLHHAFPKKVNDIQTWPQCQRCLPHAQACAELIKDYEFIFLEAAQLLNQAGYYLREQASYREAEEYLLQALAVSEKLGPEHILYTARLLNNLARLYFDQYKYSEAEPLYEQALAIREQKLGSEDPVIARNLNSLALNYWYEDKYAEAEPLYQRALSISERKLGPEDAQTLYTLNNIALLYRSLGRYEETIKLNQHVLETRERKFGFVHLDVAQSLQNLAVTYYEQGNQSKYEEAEGLLKQALAIREALLPKKHLQIARCLRYLALVYKVQDKDEQAEECFKRAVEICEELLGEDHSQTIETKEKYAALLRKMQRDEEAVILETQIKAIQDAKSSRK